MIMNKRTPVPGYRLLPSSSTKLKLKDNHYETPCKADNFVVDVFVVVVVVFVALLVVAEPTIFSCHQ